MVEPWEAVQDVADNVWHWIVLQDTHDPERFKSACGMVIDRQQTVAPGRAKGWKQCKNCRAWEDKGNIPPTPNPQGKV